MSTSVVFAPGNTGTVNINTINIVSSPSPPASGDLGATEAGAAATVPTATAAPVTATTTTTAAVNVAQTEQPELPRPPNFACFGSHVKHQFLCMITAGGYRYEDRYDPVDRARLIEFLQEPALKQKKKDLRDKNLRLASRNRYELAADNVTLMRRKGTAANAREGALVCPSHEEIFDIMVAEHMKFSYLQRDKVRPAINQKYYGIAESEIKWILARCTTCIENKHCNVSAPIEAIVVNRTLERVQIDLIDMRKTPSGKYKWILHVKTTSARLAFCTP